MLKEEIDKRDFQEKTCVIPAKAMQLVQRSWIYIREKMIIPHLKLVKNL
jgi:hypothetical protein